MRRPRLWVYKCNTRPRKPHYSSGDWLKFLSKPSTRDWGGTRDTSDPASLNILKDQIGARRDEILCYQSNRRAAVGVCRVVRVQKVGKDERRLWLKPVQVFERIVKLHELKKRNAALASVEALRHGPVGMLCGTSSTEARILLGPAHK